MYTMDASHVCDINFIHPKISSALLEKPQLLDHGKININPFISIDWLIGLLIVHIMTNAVNNGELLAAFRQKATFMKSWKPSSVPSVRCKRTGMIVIVYATVVVVWWRMVFALWLLSLTRTSVTNCMYFFCWFIRQNRDRLELYAWHKQVVSGDAPVSMQTSLTAAEKAKYNAWKAKSGVDNITAMQNYIQESERQVRVYGYNANAALPTTTTATGTSNDVTMSNPEDTNPRNNNGSSATSSPSRGLAAIPLLCAAASEQREAYLRRLQNTPTGSAWWRRQEPLTTVAPNSLAAVPERMLLLCASFLERISLAEHILQQPIPLVVRAVIQSALWPLHNALLATWMGWILIATVLSSAVELSKTVLLGSRRTGRTLDSIYNDEVLFGANSVSTLIESHQPLSARVVGLVLQPYAFLVHVVLNVLPTNGMMLYIGAAYAVIVAATWWYWVICIPWFLVVVLLGTSMALGGCFGLIELASQV
jgi:acyl-CoA-binding protein